ncbi:MAG: efflux RND transporter periplasmic adaptor subunit [Victivallales bacterium]|nr:efflux RND transporter periplasmic adaptor subunit [Victivallales bacterium]
MLRHITVCFAFLALLLMGQEADESYNITKQTFPYIVTIRVKTMTEKSAKINNPVRWLPLSELIPDGTLVKKDQVIARFNTEYTQFELDSQLLEEAVIDANLQRRLANIENNNIDMDDQMGELDDKLKTAEAKLARLLSEPNPDDVRIAEGRQRIAALNLKAAQKDYDKAQDRFKRGMISRAELDADEETLQQNQIKKLFADRELQTTKEPYDLPGSIHSTRLEIENCKLEIEKLAFEIKEQKKISEIQRVGASSQKKHKEREIKEKQDDIQKSEVKAPIDGYVSHNRVDNEELTVGMKMWPNFAFMEIPDLSTIGFQGELHESDRKYFNDGDEVIVRLNGRLQQPLVCKLRSISTLSHDIADKKNAGWGDEQKLGVKVFDLIIQKTEEASWLRPGMVGTAELKASKPLEGPTVPLQFVHYIDGKHYISFEGVYTEVTGTPINSWFVLDDAVWEGRTVTMHGKLVNKVMENQQEEKRFSASGELDPVRKTDVIVPPIGWWPWPKVTWLVPEETYVKKGDVVAKLDPQERQKQIDRIETNAASVRASCEEAEKNVEITRINGEFKLKMAKNTLEIARQTAKNTLEIFNPLPIYRAEMNRDLAKVNLLSAKRKVDREEARETPTMSPAELQKLKRNQRRMELNLEKAQLNLDKAIEGATQIARSKARLNLKSAENTYELTAKTVQFDNVSAQREFEQTKQRLEEVEQRLRRRKEERDNHTIYSPADGIICYNKVRNGNVFAKIAIGNTVGPRFNIMSIPDLSEMEMKVEVPEKYYSQIKDGMEVEVRVPSLTNAHLPGVVTSVDLLFTNKTKKDSQIGLYSSHEPLGEVVFNVRIRIHSTDVKLKPGLIGEVFFPFTK